MTPSAQSVLQQRNLNCRVFPSHGAIGPNLLRNVSRKPNKPHRRCITAAFLQVITNAPRDNDVQMSRLTSMRSQTSAIHVTVA